MTSSMVRANDAARITSPPGPAVNAESVAALYGAVRTRSETLCKPLQIEDYSLQAKPETSPAKWHIAHTSWFFETFILKVYCPDYQAFNDQFEYLFNSYYNGVGQQFPRHQRGLLSRPGVEQIYQYRAHVDSCMQTVFSSPDLMANEELLQRITLGCHHEQQHQELFFTDLKYCWFQNPLLPAYNEEPLAAAMPLPALTFQRCEAGLYTLGHQREGEFSFDNELPVHQVYLQAFHMADRLVSNGEFLAFIEDGGYQRPELWLADGWAGLQAPDAKPCPLYWLQRDNQWFEYSLHGLQALDPNLPVTHVCAYEADAYARWRGCRLPTEFEWEVSIGQQARLETLQSLPKTSAQVHPTYQVRGPHRLQGKLWQWTSSAYSPYPGFKPAQGAIGEYNGKFMANQLVLRGGSCVTAPDHYRHSYRNFFYPQDQWQFTGICLAKDD